MRRRIFATRTVVGATALLWAAGAGATTTIDFDDRTGHSGFPGGPCASQFQVDDEYTALGILFSSNDPAVCVLEASNAPSAPNVVAGITSGDIDFTAPVEAAFFDGASPVAVGSARVVITDLSDSTVIVEAYDENGALLGTSGKTGPGKHLLYFPELIHSVRISGGAFAVDDFVFTETVAPAPVPALAPTAELALALGLLATAGRALRRPSRRHVAA